MSERNEFDIDNLDEFDDFDDADDDELFEKESQAEDFEERMARESEAYLKGVDDGGADAYGGAEYDPFEDDRDMIDEERDRYEEGYYDGYDSEDDLDEE